MKVLEGENETDGVKTQSVRRGRSLIQSRGGVISAVAGRQHEVVADVCQLGIPI